MTAAYGRYLVHGAATVALEGGPDGPEMDRVELLRFNVAPAQAR